MFKFNYKVIIHPKSVNEFLQIIKICKKLKFKGITENDSLRNKSLYEAKGIHTVITVDNGHDNIRIGYSNVQYIEAFYSNIKIIDYNDFLRWLREENYIDNLY